MNSGVLVLLLLVAVVAIPVVIRVVVGSTVDTVAGKVSSAHADRRRRHAGFTTGLGPPDVFAAASEAAAMIPGGSLHQAAAPGTATVMLGTGGVSLAVSPGADGWSRIRLTPASPGLDDGELSRFRAAMLAALRARDPNTRYG